MNRDRTPQGDSAENGIERRKFLSAGLSVIIAAPFAAALRAPATSPARVLIKKLTSDQAMELMTWYPARGHTPSLSQLLSVFLFNGEFIYKGVHFDQNKSINLGHSFFSQVHVHRILQAVISDEADERVKAKLQSHLNKLGEGMRSHTPLWRYYSGWLKKRIIDCFDPKYLPEDPETLLLSHKIDLEQLIKLPLRDPYAEKP